MPQAPPGIIFLGIIFAAIGSLIMAVVLRIAVNWLKLGIVPYWTAYLTMFIGYVAIVFMSAFIGPLLGVWSDDVTRRLTAGFILTPINFLIIAGVISWRLYIPFKKAILVNLMIIVVYLLIVAILIIISFGISFLF